MKFLGLATMAVVCSIVLAAVATLGEAAVTSTERWAPPSAVKARLSGTMSRSLNIRYNGKTYELDDDASCEEVGEALEQVVRDKELAENLEWATLEGWKERLKKDWIAYIKGEDCAEALVKTLCDYLEDFTRADEEVAKKLLAAAEAHGAFDSGGTKVCSSSQSKCCTSFRRGGNCMSRCRDCFRSCNRTLKSLSSDRYIIENFNEGRWCFARLMDAYSRGWYLK